MSTYLILTFDVPWYIFLLTLSPDKQVFVYVIYIFWNTISSCTYLVRDVPILSKHRCALDKTCTGWYILSRRCGYICLEHTFLKKNIEVRLIQEMNGTVADHEYSLKVVVFFYNYTYRYGKSDSVDNILLLQTYCYVL